MEHIAAAEALAREMGIELCTLDEQMAKFPMRFAKAIIIGPRPTAGRPVAVSTGSATFVNLGSGPTVITCQHVVSEGLTPADDGSSKLFQIGDALIDLERQLIDLNERLDIATIRLTPEQVPLVTIGEEIGTSLFGPAIWPPEPPQEGDFVAFGGFPGALRTVQSFDEIEFGTWSAGASRIDSSSDLQFVSPFERDRWVRAFGTPENAQLTALGGMSGGPVFILRGMRWDLVGIVKEYHEMYDAMFFASLHWVSDSGHILSPAV